MENKYYVQKYAKERINSILPVPNDYPLRGNFGSKFISNFSELTELLKIIYKDVVKNPDAYKCELHPLDQEPRGKGADNESNLSLNRIVKCLRTICDCGELENKILKVNAIQYKKQIKKVKDHSSIIEKMKDFGFLFQEESNKNIENIYFKNINKPDVIPTMKIYMDCWNDVLNDEYLKSEIKKNGYGCIAYYYEFYLFDYKVTANPMKLDGLQEVKDDCYTWDKDKKNVYIKFYEYSIKYPKIHFAKGNYFIGKKRICTFTECSGNQLKIKLNNLTNYMKEIEKLPEYLQECFSEKASKCTSSL